MAIDLSKLKSVQLASKKSEVDVDSLVDNLFAEDSTEQVAQEPIIKATAPAVSTPKEEAQPREDGFWNTYLGDTIEKVGAGLQNFSANTYGLLDKGARKINDLVGDTSGAHTDAAGKAQPGFFGNVGKASKQGATDLRAKSDRYSGKKFTELWEDDKAAAVGDVFLQASESLPQSLMAAFTGGAGLAAIGATAANEKYDTLKTIAHPYTYTFGHQIEAVNFKLPVKISWDSSLFHADWLPSEPVGWVNNAWISNEYFFLVNNTEDHYFDLTLDNHTIMPDSTIVGTADENPWFWLPERNFPLGIGLAQDPTLYVDEDLTRKDYFIYPNPVHSLLIVDTQKKIATVKILNTQGKCLQVIKAREFPLNIDFSGFDRGIYVIQLISNQNQYYHEKIIKAN